MKKSLLFVLLNISFLFSDSVNAQILCIFCYEQNDSISHNVNNMVLNGSFENTNCMPNVFSNSFCPNSNYYSCDVVDWVCTGGGIDSYASIDDNTFTQTADGAYAAYLGNGSFASACSGIYNDTSCLAPTGCELLNIPSGYPTNDVSYGGNNGVSLEQTVSGLTIGATYVLEFWAGGEPQAHGWMDPGVFAVDIGFGYTYLRNKPTCPGCIGTTYIIVFNATSTSHTLKFTNWGHICIPCTELIIDNVRLFTLAEISPSVPSCITVPSALFSAANDICPGTCTDFTNLSLNSVSYLWSFPGAIPSTSSDINPSNICYAAPGNYDVTLIASGPNGSDTLTLANYITVFPYPAPQGITQSGDTLFAIQGSSSYEWYHNGVLIPGATNYFHVVIQNGNYNVVCTDVNGCEVEAAIFDVVGIEESAMQGYVEVFPVPSQGEITVRCNTGKISSIIIYNIMGARTKEILPAKGPDKSEYLLNVKELPAGIYYAEVFIPTTSGAEIPIRTKIILQ